MGLIEQNLQRLGIVLPPAPKPVAAYVPFTRSRAGIVFVSGQLPFQDGKLVSLGAAPQAATLEAATAAARQCAINAMAVLKDACAGDLDQVSQILRIGVFVLSADGFDGQPKIANGASELLLQVFGEAGRHARAAVGVNALPLHATVELELVAELR